jgi:hypothetical protein
MFLSNGPPKEENDVCIFILLLLGTYLKGFKEGWS